MKIFFVILSAAVIVAIGILSIRQFTTHRQVPVSDRLASPAHLLHVAQKIAGDRPIFINQSARPIAETILSQSKADTSTIDTSGSVGNPSEWRRENREKHFGAVVFIGREAEFAPLLQHLKESPDWHLAYVDNFGIIFSRKHSSDRLQRTSFAGDQEADYQEGIAFKIPSPNDAAPPELTLHDKAIYLSQMGETLATLQDYGSARRYFEAALKLGPQLPEVLARYASFFALRGEWQRARDMADRSLQLRKDYVPALQVKVQVLLAQKSETSLWETATRLQEVAPNDPFSLFLFAKAANTVGAYPEESKALEHLITLSDAQGLPTAYYQLYLGQSLARQGLATQAKQALQAALDSHQLDPEQQKQVEEILNTIEENK